MDTTRIDELRALAFASLPSASRKPLVPSLNAESLTAPEVNRSEQDKEEGELSSDEEAQIVDTGVNVHLTVSENLGHKLVHGMCPLQDKIDSVAVLSEMPQFSPRYQDFEKSRNHGPASNFVESSQFLWEPQFGPHDLPVPVSNISSAIDIGGWSPLLEVPFAPSLSVNESTYTVGVPSSPSTLGFPPLELWSTLPHGNEKELLGFEQRSGLFAVPSERVIPKSLCGAGDAAVSKQLSAMSSNSSVAMSVSATCKKADRLLPSLSLPVVSNALRSSILSDKKDDAFVIKFSDGDSDSDEEQQHLGNANPSTTYNGPKRVSRGAATLPNSNSAPSYQNIITVSQAPLHLKDKMNSIRKHAVDIEQIKGKGLHPSNAGKGSKRPRSTFVTQQAIGSSMIRAGKSERKRQAVSDMEALRLQIAAKESELRQQRQLLAMRELGHKGGSETNKRLVSASQPVTTFTRLSSRGIKHPLSNSSGSTKAGSGNLFNQQEDPCVDINKKNTQSQNLDSTKSSNEKVQLQQSDCNLKEIILEKDVMVENNQLHLVVGLSDVSEFPTSKNTVSQQSRHQESVPSFNEKFREELSFSPRIDDCEALPLKKPEICGSNKRVRDDSRFPVPSSGSELQVSDSPSTKKQRSLICEEEPAARLVPSWSSDPSVVHGHEHSIISPDAVEIDPDIKFPSLMGLQQSAAEGVVVTSSLSPSTTDALWLAEKTPELNATDFVELTSHKCLSEDEFAIKNRVHEGTSPRYAVKGVMQSPVEGYNLDQILSVVSSVDVRPIEGDMNLVDAGRSAAGHTQALSGTDLQTHPSLTLGIPTDFCNDLSIQKVSSKFQGDSSRGLSKDMLSNGDEQLRFGHQSTLTFRNNDSCQDRHLSPDVRSPIASHPLQHSITSSVYKVHTMDEQMLVRTGLDSPLLSQKSVYDSLHPSLVQLKAEEEILDRQLEAAQQSRSRCELQERLTWKAYREAQDVLAKANLECEYYYQKREILYAQLRKAQNKYQFSRYFLEASDAMRLPVSFPGSQSLSLQELPRAESDAAQAKVKQLSAHDTPCNSLNEYQNVEHCYYEAKRMSKASGAAGIVPTTSTIINSTSIGVHSQNMTSKRLYTSQLVQKDDADSQHSTSQNVVEVEETNVDLNEIKFDKDHEDVYPQKGSTELNARLEAQEEEKFGSVQDGLVKINTLADREHKELEELENLVSMPRILKEASDQHLAVGSITSAGIDNMLMVESAKDTIVRAINKSTEAHSEDHIKTTSPKLGTSESSEVKFYQHNDKQVGRAETEQVRKNNICSSNCGVSEANDYPESGKGSTQPFTKMRGPPIIGESLQQLILQNERSNISLKSSGKGRMLPQVIEPVEECQGMRDEDESYYVKGSVNEGGVGDAEDLTQVPLLGGTVWDGTSRPTEEFTHGTVMNEATILAAAINAPIASRQRTVEKVKQPIDPVEIRFLRVSGQENSFSENYQEAQFGLRNKEHYSSKHPTDCCIPSADLMVVFSNVFWAGPEHVRVSIVSPEKTSFSPELMADSSLPLVGYESPLSGFRRHHTYLGFSADLESSTVSSSPSYAINPFQPLCKFEHRGICNDDDCSWQHRNEQTLSKKAASRNLRWKDYVTQVPTYKIGNHVMGDDMDALTSVRCMIQRRYKHETSQTHLFSLSIQRSFPLDMPCLLEPLKSQVLWDSKYLGAFDMPSRQHSGDDFERRAYVEHVLREPCDVEAWLDLALNIMEYDLHKLDSNSEKNALFVLSRALEANPTSVSLWIVYLHTYYWHQKSLGKDDMFDHAVKQNRGSYELWLLYIRSRFHIRQRLDSFELAITAICDVPEEMEFRSSHRSSQILDLVLRMFHCMCVSKQTQDAFSWVDDLCLDASARSISDMAISRRACTIAVLEALHPQDACILWVSCAYLLVCHQLPSDVIRRLGYKQHLLYGLNWMDQRGKSEVSDNNALRLFQIAISNGIGCLDANSSPSSIDENIFLARQSLVVNYVQFLAVVKGPEQAAMLGQHFMLQFPRCVELVVLCARIKQRHADVDAALSVFEEALLRWPINLPGSLRLWNQYAGHALEWKGKDSACLVLCKCASYLKEDRKSDDIKRVSRFSVSLNSVVETIKESVPHFDVEVIRGALQSKCDQVRTGGVNEAISVQETAYALLNLALFEALNENFGEAEIVAEKVIELPLDEEFMHCWKEFLALKFLVSHSSTGSGGLMPMYETLIRLFDRCYLCAQLLPKPNPLSKQFLESFKKRRVRCFFENLLGPPPLDSSLFNSILETYFGPELLPKEQYSFSDLVDFYGGLLEFVPSNVELALSFCRAAFHNSSSKEHPTSVAAAFWAASMLTYSLFHSHPLAPEVHWVKAGVFLEDLGFKDAVQQFYNYALLSYPFSSALWRSFIAFSSRCGDRAAAVKAANDRGLVFD